MVGLESSYNTTVGLESSYNTTVGLESSYNTTIGVKGSYNTTLGVRGSYNTTVHGLMYKTFIHQSHDHLIYLLINHTNPVMPSPRCISHVQQYYDHLIQILNQSPLNSWCHNQYIFHPSIINHDHSQLISLYHH